MNFASDNTTGASAEILQALTDGNGGRTMPYGDDPHTAGVDRQINEIFERDCAVFLVATGTASNALALSALTPPYGAILCHQNSHANVHECGAPELFTGGAKLITVDGDGGKIDPFTCARLAERGQGDVHWVQPAALTLTNATEVGTCYTPDDVQALSTVCRRHGLGLHMDGTRFANAVVSLGVSPADLSWRAGLDVLSLGATKNGALAAEAVIFFDPGLASDFMFRRKRAGHLFSKMRFLSLQMSAYLKDGHWLSNARHANGMAKRLGDGFSRLPGVTLAHPVEANMVFATLSPSLSAGLKQDGFKFYEMGSNGLVRFVCAFDTQEADVDALITAGARHADTLHRTG